MSWTCPRCHADYRTERERCEADGWKLVENMVGRTIGERYFIEKLIGVGGMRSTIWRALQRPTDRPVAVKILPAANAEEAQRFERGARIASNLNHPHITTVHDYGTAPDSMFYLVMELLEGQTLQHMLRQGTIGLIDTLVMVDQVLRALEHAHQLNVVHRDLKPSNLFVTRKNDDIYFVKIMDFGLAKLATTGTESSSDEDDAVEPMEPRGPSEERTAHTIATGIVDLNDITQAQRICGTPEYMAPEQILGAPLDRRTDLYALGVILYRMIAGQLPFRSRIRHELYQMHLSMAPPAMPPTVTAPEVLVRLVMKALAKRPADRFADASEMRVALRAANRVIAGELGHSFTGLFPSDASSSKPRISSGGSVAVPVHEVRKKRTWPIAAGALLLGGAIATLIVLSSRDADDAPTAQGALPVEPVAEAPKPSTPERPKEPPVNAPAPAALARRNAAEPMELEPVLIVNDALGHGTVAITTTPRVAEVLRDGKSIGTTPMQLVLPAGDHLLELRAKDHAPSVVPVTVVEGEQLTLELTLQPVETAHVRVTPSGPGSGARRRPAMRESNDPEANAPESAAPVAPILGRDVAEPTGQPVKVLGRDLTQEQPKVKILGSQIPSPEPKVKVLGQ